MKYASPFTAGATNGRYQVEQKLGEVGKKLGPEALKAAERVQAQ